MAKTKFFRVAVEGATVDGRAISKEQIQQMADSYAPATYTARINCEHLRSYSPDKPFNSWGSVDALKTESIDLAIGGKTEKRLALFAQLDVNDQAMEYNSAGQKLFSSVEIQPNFADTGKAYLVGLAFTDSPASLGTELLKFSARDDKRKDNLLAIEDEAISLSFEQEPAGSEMTSFLSGLKAFFSSHGKTPEPPAVVPPAKVEASSDMAQFVTQFGEQMASFGATIEAGFTKINASVASLRADHDAMKADIEKTPNRNHSTRPVASGDEAGARAEC